MHRIKLNLISTFIQMIQWIQLCCVDVVTKDALLPKHWNLIIEDFDGRK